MEIFDAYERHLTTLRRSENTIRTYTTLLRAMDRDLPNGLLGACRDELEEHLAGLASDSSVILNRAVLRGFFGWACDPDDQWLDYDPTTRLSRPKSPEPDPKPVASADLAHILANAAEPYRTLFVLAAYAGLRCIEISRVERRHITDQVLLVRRGKGNKLRRIPTHPILWRAVADLPGTVKRTV
jgi:integrase/recombinase XerC